MSIKKITDRKLPKPRDEIWLSEKTPASYFRFCSKMSRTIDEGQVIEFINNFKPKNKKIIVDLGIGPGRELSWLAKLKNISKIIGIDYSQSMLDFCRKQSQKIKAKIILFKDDLLTLGKFNPPKEKPIIYLYLFNSLGDFTPDEREIILQNIKKKMGKSDILIATLSKRPEEINSKMLEKLPYREKSVGERKKIGIIVEYGSLPFLWNVALEKYKRLPQLWYDNKNNNFLVYLSRGKILFSSHRWSKKEIVDLFRKADLKIEKLIEGEAMYTVISKIK